MPWEIDKIIESANELAGSGHTGASTSEQIAAAFVLNRMDYLPGSYTDVIAAWDRLGPDWQGYVRLIKRDYPHKLQPW